MKIKLKQFSVFFLSLVSTLSVASDIEQVVSIVKQKTVSNIEDKINDFIFDATSNLGKGKTTFVIKGIDSNKPSYSINTIQPLTIFDPSIKELVYLQGSAESGENEGSHRNIVNLGLGKRYLLEDDYAVAGINLFLDYEGSSKHKRASLGLEYQRSNFGISANKYYPISDKKIVGDYYEEVLPGHDINLFGQMPYTPWAKIKGSHYYWDQTVGENINGHTLGLELQLSPSMSFEVGQENSNTTERQSYGVLSIKLPVSRNEKPTNFTFEHTPFRRQAAMDLTDLNFVERSNNIKIEKTLVSTPGVTVSGLSNSITEAGETAIFTIVFNSQPTADVVIGISSSDTTEGTVSTSSLTFTSSNWNTAQTVTVTGVDDNENDGDVTYNIIIADAVSSDSEYSGLTIPNISVTNTDDDLLGQSITFNGNVYITVVSPDTGRIWLDRNLGATQVATSSSDSASYGYLYQWGRNDDGHESRTSSTTSTIPSDSKPAHSDFILNSFDWTTDSMANRGIVVSGHGNLAWHDGSDFDICPAGFRVPTLTEMTADTTGATTVPVNSQAAAMSSFLKLPLSGYRSRSTGTVAAEGTTGYYFTSNYSGSYAKRFNLTASPNFSDGYPGNGMSVRCIKH